MCKEQQQPGTLTYAGTSKSRLVAPDMSSIQAVPKAIKSGCTTTQRVSASTATSAGRPRSDTTKLVHYERFSNYGDETPSFGAELAEELYRKVLNFPEGTRAMIYLRSRRYGLQEQVSPVTKRRNLGSTGVNTLNELYSLSTTAGENSSTIKDEHLMEDIQSTLTRLWTKEEYSITLDGENPTDWTSRLLRLRTYSQQPAVRLTRKQLACLEQSCPLSKPTSSDDSPLSLYGLTVILQDDEDE